MLPREDRTRTSHEPLIPSPTETSMTETPSGQRRLWTETPLSCYL